MRVHLKVAVTAIVLCLTLSAVAPAQADVITFFDFNSSLTESSGGTRPSTLTNNFGPNSSGTINPGSNVNADPDGSGPFPGSAAGIGLTVFNNSFADNTSNQGKYLQFGLDTTGYQNLNVSFAAANFGNGFANNNFQYSLDGTTFMSFAFFTPTAYNGEYGLQSFNLSSIAGLNNNANTAFRIVFDGAPDPNSFGLDGFDNLSVSGTSATTATPEPETWATMALGVFALGIVHWRRKRTTSQLSPLPSGMAF